MPILGYARERMLKENIMSESFPAPASASSAPIPDPIAFEIGDESHLDSLYRNALRLTGNSNDAEDLVQDTYLRAFRFFHQYEMGTNAKAWLFRIMNTVFLNDYRKKSRQGEPISYDGLEDFYLYNRIAESGFSPSQAMSTANPEEVVLERLDIEAIEAAIQKLPDEFRDTVALANSRRLGVSGDQRDPSDPDW